MGTQTTRQHTASAEGNNVGKTEVRLASRSPTGTPDLTRLPVQSEEIHRAWTAQRQAVRGQHPPARPRGASRSPRMAPSLPNTPAGRRNRPPRRHRPRLSRGGGPVVPTPTPPTPAPLHQGWRQQQRASWLTPPSPSYSPPALSLPPPLLLCNARAGRAGAAPPLCRVPPPGWAAAPRAGRGLDHHHRRRVDTRRPSRGGGGGAGAGGGRRAPAGGGGDGGGGGGG